MSLDAQAAPSTLCADSRSREYVPGRVRPSEKDLQLDFTLEWHACTADGRVGLKESHLQPFVLQVWRRPHEQLLMEVYRRKGGFEFGRNRNIGT